VGTQLNEEVKAFKDNPFRGKLVFKKISTLEAAIYDSDKVEIIRGRSVKILWIYKAIIEKMERDQKKK